MTTAGTSTDSHVPGTARQRVEQLQGHGAAALAIDACARDRDAPLAVLADVAEGLERLLHRSELANRFEDQLPFARRLELLADDLASMSNPLVVVVERPHTWGGRWRGARSRCEQVLAQLRNGGASLITVDPPESLQLRTYLLDLARQLLGEPDVMSLEYPWRSVEDLAAATFGRIMGLPTWRATLGGIAQMAAHRSWWPAGDAVPSQLEAVLERSGQERRLPPTLRSALVDAGAVTDLHRRRAHREIQGALQAARATADPSRHRLAVEAAAASARLGDADGLEDAGPIASESLAMLAEETARSPVRRGQAVDVARRATALDAGDLDARRLFAGLLDDTGTDLEATEALWRSVVEDDPTDQHSHEALVSLLLATADEDGARIAWQQARRRLAESGSPADPSLLHLPVAATALRRARTALAREALFDVPGHQRLPTWQALHDLLVGLEAARDGRDFVPIGEMGPRWWERGPRLLAERDPSDGGARLRTWVAGRVSSVDDGVAVVDGAAVELDGGAPEDEHLLLDPEAVEALSGDPIAFDDLLDRYVEYGIYADENGRERYALRIHRRDRIVAMAPVRDPRRVLAADTP